jgi:hypothetical protein
MNTGAEPNPGRFSSERPQRLVEDSAAQGPVQVRGRTEPVQVYGVTGHRYGRSRLEVSIDRGLTPLVGRALDLSRAHKVRGHEAWSLQLLGEIHGQQDPPAVELAEAG